jgi:glutamate formiminotransferase
LLLAVPNFSEGRDGEGIARIAEAFARGAVVLDLHSDAAHNRSVVTLAGPPGSVAGALESGARACVESIDVSEHEGAHPRIGALDVCPVVWTNPDDRAAALDEAREAARLLASDLHLPVFLYGELASSPQRRERAFFREGGPLELRRRLESGELRPDLGPPELHPTAGAVLVTARPPLAAFNLELSGADRDVAGEVAARLRESGGGLPGVRAIAIELDGGRWQVSTNVHDPLSVSLGEVTGRVRELAGARGAEVASAEIVGLVPEGALAGFPDDVPIPGFDPARHVVERRLN